MTRNEKDKQGKGSGPYTNENIEVYNTIFAIAESPHDANTVWAGTDDGLLHVTRDGGANWTNVTPRGVGRGLINSIEVSPHDPSVVYVVAMKYKEGDNAPYVYKTSNYGRSWTRISDGLPTNHFTRVVREDPQRADLLFAGMERGLYVSFNGGEDWQAFQTNLPIVPITDLMVRRNDLVLATQGRAFWVIDDIAPLRQYAAEHENAAAHLYDPSLAYRLTPTQGRNGAGESFAPSAPDGAVIYYSLAEEPDLDEQTLKIEILSTGGDVIRTLKTDKEKGVEGATTLELANVILLITSMDIASIKDTALALEMLRAAEVSEDKVKLTINHCTSSNSLREEDVERVLEYGVTWRIPHDYHVASSTQLGIPIVIAKPYARVARAVTDMAYALSGAPRERKGFLERFLGRAV